MSHRLHLDASALVKRYAAEPGSDLVGTEMQATEGWYISRIGFIEHAPRLTLDDDLRSLDALHLTAALLLSFDETVFVTWDRRLHAAAQSHQLRVLPASLP